MDEKKILEIVSRVRADGRDALTEVEGLSLLEAMGVTAPKFHYIKGSKDVEGIVLHPGERAVVKVISPEILHKTEMGGVKILPNSKAEIKAAIADMEARFAKFRVDGYTVNEFVPYEPKLGHEIIVGYRFAKDFGPVVSFGPGGIYTEFLAKQFRPGAANVFFSPETADRALVERVLSKNAVRTLVSGGLRNTKPDLKDADLADVAMAFLEAGKVFARAGIAEFEVNPFVISKAEPKRLVALDVLVKLGPVPGTANDDLVLGKDGNVANVNAAARPTEKIDRILKPASAAVIGVSEKAMNNGRIILNNLIQNGFDRKRLYVVKDGVGEIDGCACVKDVQSLPERVDLFIVVIPAAQVPALLTDLAVSRKAESIIVIPGGLEEKEGTEKLVEGMKKALRDSRESDWKGPLINGGNCLGIRSVPGKYNTLFIPEYKLPMPKGKVAPVAVISQSGAFAICRVSKHPEINPKYVITCGNQMDVTIGDYLERLERDPDIEIFAVYVEGFKPMDGAKVLAAARRIVESGRTVIFYRAGRTAAGAAASASHTASIAGDYPVTRELLSQIGVVVAETLDEFDDTVTLFSLLRGRKARGFSLGAVSNAGFECVAFADNLGKLELAKFGSETGKRLEAVFAKAKISEIVDVHNPIDLTPMAGDEAYHETAAAVLADPAVHAGIVGIVPLTVMMNTLAAGSDSNGEDVMRVDSIASRYGKLMAETDKPWVCVVDSGSLYDPLARELEARGVPTFRTADRALKTLNVWLDATLGR